MPVVSEGHPPPGADAKPAADPAAPTLTLDWRSGVWIALGVYITFLIVGFFRNVPDSLSRIGIGLLLAFALDPVVTRVRQRFGCSRPTAVGIVGVIVSVTFAALILLVGPPAIDQAREFGQELPETVADLYDIPLAGQWLRDAEAAEHAREWAADLPASIDTGTVTQTARTLLDGIVAGLVVVFVGLAVLVDGERLVGRMKQVIPDSVQPQATQAGRIFYRTIGAYFSGSLLVAALAAIVILIAGLALGVPLAPVAALWMLLVNLIPQIGGLLGGGFFIVLAFSSGVWKGLAALAFYLVYQQIENHLIQPAIVGRAVDLSAPATMLAALVGGAVAGVPGALVATPLVGATKALYLEVRYGEVPEEHLAVSLVERVRRRFRRSG